MVAELWANHFLKIGFSAISRLRDVGLRRSILHSIPLVKTLLLRYHVKKGKVDPRCRPTMLCLNASSTICRRIGVIFSIFWSIHHSTRLDERNRMQYRSLQSDDPNSNEDQIIAQRYCSTLPQRFVNGSSMAVGLFLNRFQWSIAHFTQLDELFHMRYHIAQYDAWFTKKFLTPKNLSNCLAASTKNFFRF